MKQGTVLRFTAEKVRKCYYAASSETKNRPLFHFLSSRRSDAGHFDAVLMDMRMPVMDGLSAARAIRESDHPDAARIPIIALTANAFEEDVRLCLEAGMNAHLSKPVDIDQLKALLGKIQIKKENPHEQ